MTDAHLPPVPTPHLPVGIVPEHVTDPEAVADLVHEMRRLLMTYKFGIDEVMTKITVLRDEFRSIHDYNPIEHLGSRLKSLDSIVAKAQRKGIELTPDVLRSRMFDIAGVRITCGFVSDIDRVRDMLLGQADLTLLEERDYIREPKANGYKSLHLILEVPVYLSDRVEPVAVEVQLRTIAMDFWASLEHKIYYKFDRDVPEHILTDLKLAADVASQLDRSMERIHDEVKVVAASDGGPDGASVRPPLPPGVLAALLRSTGLDGDSRGES
ncbi:GTP pyrophosphokinase family protein [Cellulomonas sp. PhB143]|uniref:GTP pyrophosphokinase n=1 Tax=Cellulomonas sp. PhB143 TaxID=2485186 RepID=UPI000FB3353E|nr:GTP pyrophosphokinase family protein [Cellulomonas sp. PhB143]ROS73634.1 putative GTP pyrophosphokinase [Cellulomonas sp. PhB143]